MPTLLDLVGAINQKSNRMKKIILFLIAIMLGLVLMAKADTKDYKDNFKTYEFFDDPIKSILSIFINE